MVVSGTVVSGIGSVTGTSEEAAGCVVVEAASSPPQAVMTSAVTVRPASARRNVVEFIWILPPVTVRPP